MSLESNLLWWSDVWVAVWWMWIQLGNPKKLIKVDDDSNFRISMQIKYRFYPYCFFCSLTDSALSVPNDYQTYQMRQPHSSVCRRDVSNISSVCCHTFKISQKIVSISTFTRPYKVSFGFNMINSAQIDCQLDAVAADDDGKLKIIFNQLNSSNASFKS